MQLRNHIIIIKKKMVESTKQTITTERVSQVIRTSAHMYEACLRNNYKMPKLTSSLVTMKFMQGVKAGTVWCPRISDCGSLPKCYSLPPRNILFQKCVDFVDSVDQTDEQMDSVKKLLAMMKKRQPDADWLCDLLALWKPTDEIFRKDYVYVRPRKATVAVVELDNADNFYDDLPLLPPNVVAKTRRMRVPKSIRVRAALSALEAR